MAVLSSIIVTKSMKETSPVTLAISILVISIMTSMMVFKNTLSSWIAFVIILTFSSGMMTLFMYTSALTSNESSKTKKQMTAMTPVMLIILTLPNQTEKKSEASMKEFSTKTSLMVMAMILILTLLAISNHGHHPNQTVSSSF